MTINRIIMHVRNLTLVVPLIFFATQSHALTFWEFVVAGDIIVDFAGDVFTDSAEANMGKIDLTKPKFREVIIKNGHSDEEKNGLNGIVDLAAGLFGTSNPETFETTRKIIAEINRRKTVKQELNAIEIANIVNVFKLDNRAVQSAVEAIIRMANS